MARKKKNPVIDTPAANNLLGMGYRFYWEDDDQFDWEDLDPETRDAAYAPAEWIVLIDPSGNQVDAMGGVLFNSEQNSSRRAYRREVEEEMAHEFYVQLEHWVKTK